MAKGKSLTKEEELLLQDFSRDVSKKSSLLFYGNAVLVSLLPLYLFTRIHLMELNLSLTTLLLLAIVSGTSTWLISSAYKDNKFVLKHKIAQKKGDIISKEVARQVANDKNLSKREKDDRILTEKNEVSDYEAMTFSIFYTNALFLVSTVVVSSFILGPLTGNPSTNYALSVLGSAGLASLLSVH